MRIGVDYTAAVREGAGIGRYTRELLSALLPLAEGHVFILMAGVKGLRECWDYQTEQLQENCAATLKLRPLPLSDDWMARLWQRLRLPLPATWITGPVDLFYSPNFVLPPLPARTPSLLTIHDLSFLRHPETFPSALRAYLEEAVPRSVARASHILADSEATRQDVIELLEVAPAQVTTLHLGVAAAFSPDALPDERERLHALYGIAARPYLLALGTVQPRKNYVRLMQAVDPLAAQHDLELVIVGQPAWLSDPILEAATERDYVRVLGFCNDSDLPALYRQAKLFAFPSLYEGFGLPPLEAMACGTPVVASASSSIPEAVGEAGLLLDPLDVAAWRTTLARLWEDEELQAQLRRAGLARAATFTWERTARRWLEVVEEHFRNFEIQV